MLGELTRAGALLGAVALFALTLWRVVRATLGWGSWAAVALPALGCLAVLALAWWALRDSAPPGA